MTHKDSFDEHYERLLVDLYIYENKPTEYFMKKYKKSYGDIQSAYSEMLCRKRNGLPLPMLEQVLTDSPKARRIITDRRRHQNKKGGHKVVF